MSTSLFDLSGKVALVTGASRGIGEAIARLLAEQGAHVIVSSRKFDDCKLVADSIRADGGNAEALACHVGSMDDITRTFDTIKEAHGRLDTLVNNAATNPYFGHILDTDLTAYSKTVEVNVRGYFFMSVEAGKLMREQGGGCHCEYRFCQRASARSHARHLRHYQGGGNQYDQGLRQGVCAAGYSLQRHPARTNTDQVRRCTVHSRRDLQRGIENNPHGASCRTGRRWQVPFSTWFPTLPVIPTVSALWLTVALPCSEK